MVMGSSLIPGMMSCRIDALPANTQSIPDYHLLTVAAERPPPKRDDDQKRSFIALYLQKVYRGFRARQHAKALIRQRFCESFGENGDRACVDDLFSVSSRYMPQLLFILRSEEEMNLNLIYSRRFYACESDVQSLFNACDLFLKSIKERSSEWKQVFTRTSNPSSINNRSKILKSRLKCLLRICFRALPEVWLYRRSSENERMHLLRTISALTEPSVFGNNVQIFFLKEGKLLVFRRLLLGIGEKINGDECQFLEKLLLRFLFCCLRMSISLRACDTRFCVVMQILTLPSLWKVLPSLTQKIMMHDSFLQYFGNIYPNLSTGINVYFPRKNYEIPTIGFFLVNSIAVALRVLEDKSICDPTLVQKVLYIPFCLQYVEVMEDLEAVDKRNVCLLENGGNEDKIAERRREIKEVRDQFLRFSLARAAESLSVYCENPKDKCNMSYLVRDIKILYSVVIRSKLEIVCEMQDEMRRVLRSFWGFIKFCDANKSWPSKGPSGDFRFDDIGSDAPSWMVPMTIFCSLYGTFLKHADYHSFYKAQEEMFSFKDVKLLIRILKKKMWYVYKTYDEEKDGGLDSVETSNSWKLGILCLTANAMRMLQDWNCKTQFTSPMDFSIKEIEGKLPYEVMDGDPFFPNKVMNMAPFLIPFHMRTLIYLNIFDHEQEDESTLITVKKSNLLEDAIEAMHSLSDEQLQGSIQVMFLNDSGKREAVLDGSSSLKKLVEAVTEQAFHPKFGLFKESRDHSLYPNPDSAQRNSHHLRYFEFLGKILGKAIHDGILIDLLLNKFILRKLITHAYNNANDLLYLDSEIYNGLFSLKHYQGSFSLLGLYFVARKESGEEVELVKGGKHKKVSSENVTNYVNLMANYYLNSQIEKQCQAFVRGVSQVIYPAFFFAFNEDELQNIISGSTEPIDIDDLQENTAYKGYTKKDQVILAFWKVVKGFNYKLRKNLLKFVTGVSRSPVLGFSYLRPPFTICRGSGDFPTSSTCQNLLKLPPYKSRDVLERKLLQAIRLSIFTIIQYSAAS